MKKTLIFGIMILALLSLPLGMCMACGEDDTTVYTITVNDHNPAESGPAVSWDEWEAWVEAESEGRLEIEVIHGGALLANDAEAYQGTIDGVCDIAHYVIDSEQGFLLSLVTALPFMGWPEQHVEDTYYDLMDEFSEMENEWNDDLMILSLMMMPPTQLHTIDKVVVIPDDVAGMSIIGAEAMTIKALDVAGATVADVPIPEMTPSLMTGLAQGVINHFPVCGIFGALDVLECHTVFGGGGINMTPMFAIMNKDFFNGLPGDLQDILIESGDKWLEFQTANDNLSMESAMAICTDHTFTDLTPTQIAVWRDLIKADIHDEWIADCEAAGLPGQELYDRVLEIIASY